MHERSQTVGASTKGLPRTQRSVQTANPGTGTQIQRKGAVRQPEPEIPRTFVREQSPTIPVAPRDAVAESAARVQSRLSQQGSEGAGVEVEQQSHAEVPNAPRQTDGPQSEQRLYCDVCLLTVNKLKQDVSRILFELMTSGIIESAGSPKTRHQMPDQRRYVPFHDRGRSQRSKS